jgi:hypothetical protein
MMRNWLRRWLGIETLEEVNKQTRTNVEHLLVLIENRLANVQIRAEKAEKAAVNRGDAT